MATPRSQARLSEAGVYVDRFRAVEAGLPGHGDAALAESRRRAIERFAATGFPSPKDEAFKYTNLTPLLKTPFAPAAASANGVAQADFVRFMPAGIEGPVLVFVDGHIRPALCRLADLPTGVELRSLAATAEGDPGLLAARLHADADDDTRPLRDLNAAFAQDGAVIRVADGVSLEAPIHLVFVATTRESPALVAARNLIALGEGSRATILESYLGAADQRYWTSVVSEIDLAAGARLDHVKIQAEGGQAYHIAETETRLAAAAGYANFTLSLGGRLARNGITAEIGGSEVECHLSGIYLGRGRQHLDTTTWIDHAEPGSLSRQVYKGVLDDAAHGVFQGKVTVRPHAQKTDAHQLNKNLMLSETAQVDTKPELEIFADDVKCSHGATAGELDEEAMFYLRTRGIDVAAARRLLIDGFVAEVLEEVASEPLRRHLAGFVAGWLGSAEG